jgi:acetoacetate decarboxylase
MNKRSSMLEKHSLVNRQHGDRQVVVSDVGQAEKRADIDNMKAAMSDKNTIRQVVVHAIGEPRQIEQVDDNRMMVDIVRHSS